MHLRAPQPVPEADGHWLLGSAREIAAQPHEFVRNIAREHGGIASFRILHRRLYATVDPDHAHHIFVAARERYRRAFQSRNVALLTGNGLLAIDGDRWESHRRLIQPVLHGDHVRKLVPAVAALTHDMLARWRDTVDAASEMQRLAIAVIVRSLFSTEADVQFADTLGAAAREAALLLRKRNLSLFPAPKWMPTRNNRTLWRRSRLISDVVTSRIDAPASDDILTALRQAGDPRTGRPFSREELIDEMRTLLLAGFETTATSLAWTLYLLGRHAAVAERWRQEVDRVVGNRSPEWEDLPKLRYTSWIVSESMRLYPPVYTLPRECTESDELGGYTIPKGATVLVSVYGIHRAECWGEDAEAFRPERFESASWPRRAFLPFGMGKHLCAGNQFALTEMLTILACIAQRFRIEHDNTDPVEPRAQVTLVPSGSIRLRLQPR